MKLQSQTHRRKYRNEGAKPIKMKKAIVLALVLTCFLALFGCGADRSIGKLSGAENEYITIDNVQYVLDTDNDFSNKDKDKYLGQVSNSIITMKIYSVKGDTEGDYIYALWDWEGAFYKREK